MKIAFLKKKLRNRIKKELGAQSSKERTRRSLKIQNKLWRYPAFQKASRVFFYVSMPQEVDTHRMIEKALRLGKRVAVSRADIRAKTLQFFEIKNLKSDVAVSTFGILEPRAGASRPVTPKGRDCVLVPGVVFDLKKRRIGHGAGFYDRFLATLGPKTRKVGLAFSFQVMEEDLPQEKHDIPLDELITD